MTPTNINIFSLNVGMSSSLAGVISLVQSERLDLLFLQEIKLSGPEIEAQLPGFCAIANIDPECSSKPGSAIAWRSALPVENVCPLSAGRLQVARLGPYHLVNIYSPSGSDKKGKEKISFQMMFFMLFSFAL